MTNGTVHKITTMAIAFFFFLFTLSMAQCNIHNSLNPLQRYNVPYAS